MSAALDRLADMAPTAGASAPLWLALADALREMQEAPQPSSSGPSLTRKQAMQMAGKRSESAFKRWLARWGVRSFAHNLYRRNAIEAAKEREASSALYSRRKKKRAARTATNSTPFPPPSAPAASQRAA